MQSIALVPPTTFASVLSWTVSLRAILTFPTTQPSAFFLLTFHTIPERVGRRTRQNLVRNLQQRFSGCYSWLSSAKLRPYQGGFAWCWGSANSAPFLTHNTSPILQHHYNNSSPNSRPPLHPQTSTERTVAMPNDWVRSFKSSALHGILWPFPSTSRQLMLCSNLSSSSQPQILHRCLSNFE